MIRILGFFLAIISMSALAINATRISNIKCDGGWISSGTSKLEVISYCGSPKYTDVTSGDNVVKREDLLYTIKRKDYIISIRDGKVTEIGMIK